MTHDSAAPAADTGHISHSDTFADTSHFEHHHDHHNDHHDNHQQHHHHHHHHDHHHHHRHSDPEAGIPLPTNDSPFGRRPPPNYGSITRRQRSRNTHSSRTCEEELLSGLKYIFPSVILCLFIFMAMYYFTVG